MAQKRKSISLLPRGDLLALLKGYEDEGAYTYEQRREYKWEIKSMRDKLGTSLEDILTIKGMISNIENYDSTYGTNYEATLKEIWGL